MKTLIPEKPEQAIWTDEQWKAIFAKDQDVLVAAAAGSGKTAVLVERIIQKILDADDPLDVDRLLVVTFTNAAAAEMRTRIGDALAKVINEQPDSRHLRKQLQLLNKASISTLHSFCLEVVRRYYYMVDIDPGFRIGDHTEMELLQYEVLDSVFEEEYGKEDNESFFHLVDTFTGDRSDDELQELVLRLHQFSRSHPSPDLWLDALVEVYDLPKDAAIDDLPFADLLKSDIKLQLEGALQMLENARKLAYEPGGPSPRLENFNDDLEVIHRLQEAAEGSWDQLYTAMNSWKFTRAKPCKGDDYEEALVKRADAFRKKAKDILTKIKTDLFERKAESFLRDMREMHPVYRELASLVKRFGQVFYEEKRDKGVVDFSDLEHLSLSILMDNDPKDGIIVPSEVAKGYRNQFREVLIDEYQDVNMVQETIVRLIAAEGPYDGNLFMVGDVKQSIYRFRLAEPNLFLAKYKQFSPAGVDNGLRIDLARNFRSRKEVLDGTNFIFRQIMGTQVGEIEYNEDAELVQGAGYPDDKAFPIEVALINQDEEGPEESDAGDLLDRDSLAKSSLEARFMAREIRAMLDEKRLVHDMKSGKDRRAQYKDIVILVRSLSWAEDIMEEFRHAGIPVYANVSSGYFDATEVDIMLSLLKIIDNPDQDIHLAAVLRSPVVGLDEEALAYIRTQVRRGTYYEAVKGFVREGGNGRSAADWKKCKDFLLSLEKWRNQARSGDLPELIWQLYRDTGFYDFAGGLPGGKQRQANLRALYDRASQYEETSFRGLFRFLRLIERLQERGSDMGAAKALGEQEDVVRIMTIHSSKGLEFPVVFAAGLGRKFNMKDIDSPFLYDKDYGFASVYRNVEKRISYPSFPQLALKRKKRMEMAAEEMRVLYVALTRAKEKLYLVGSVKDVSGKIEKWSSSGTGRWLLQEYDRAAAANYLDWIGPAVVRHPKVIAEHRLQGEAISQEETSDWQVRVISPASLAFQDQVKEEAADNWLEDLKAGKTVGAGSPERDLIYSRLTWKYSHQVASSRMSKQTVSEIKRVAEVRDERSGHALVSKSRQKGVYAKPQFLQEKVISPAERGTAMHSVMQHVPLAVTPDILSVESLLDELLAREILTIDQVEVISAEQIVSFFHEEIGQRLLRARKVSREVPFTLGVPASEIYADWDGKDEPVVVQGVIDCLIEDEKGMILLDYKTDAIKDRFPGGWEQAKGVFKERYQVQLDLYGRAVESIWKKKVSEKFLYFFDGSHTLKL